ncbi:MAG: hypothetical protein CL942_06725 [Desulfovibrio sp.]|nr:hypothetical protein [Desulfovibrio sp.]|tara:strand:+ start:21944 stop:23695 length:1752 start_codon:yes stop_codon:yes gene_type:complete
MYDLSKEIDVYKASLPYMEAAKDTANALQMNDHGPLHAQRVYMNAKLLCSLFDISPHEKALLLAASLLHDIGMADDRDNHHIVAHDLVLELSESGELPFSAEEAHVVATLCKWHRKDYDPDEVEEQLKIRTGLLASMIRIADSMDLDYRRSPDFQGSREKIIEKINKDQIPHHLSVLSIIALRLRVNHIGTKLELFIENFKLASLQIDRLIEELLGIRFSWPIQLAPIHSSLPKSSLEIADKKKAIVFAYCNAHGLISATITKKQLELQGFEVTTVCNHNQTFSSTTFWKETFQEFDFNDYNSVSLLDLYLDPILLDDTLKKIQENSHCSWHFASPLDVSGIEVKKMISAGVNLYLCDERALFTGNSLDSNLLFWMRVAGLCNFDNPLVTAGITRQEYDVAMGIRYEIMASKREEKEEDHYKQLMSLIAQNDLDFFTSRASDFTQHIVEHGLIGTKHGRVLVFKTSRVNGRSVYDFVHKAIVNQGVRQFENNEFETPFAIFPQVFPGVVRVLFVSYFSRSEKAFPVRYFLDYDENSIGGNSTIWQAFNSEDEALSTINTVIARINDHFQEHCDMPVESLKDPG